MLVTFDKEYLKELYESGKTKDKKHRFQPEVVKRYKRCVDYLKWASSKEALFPINSLRFEALTGDKSGMFSVRVNDKYRIEFTINDPSEEPFLTICNIVELSNHYD